MNRMKTNFWGLILLILLLFSCNYKLNEADHNLRKLFHTLNYSPKTDDKVYLIMQLTGCATCVKSLVGFVKEHAHETKLKIIISVIGKTDLGFFFSGEELKHLIIDNGANASKMDLLTGVATVYFIGKNGLREVIVINPYNNIESQQLILKFLKID